MRMPCSGQIGFQFVMPERHLGFLVKQQDTAASGGQLSGGDEAGQASSDDDHVRVQRHGA